MELHLARLNTRLPIRVIQQYNLQRGGLLSAGIGFNMFFAITGLLTIGFALAGLFLASDRVLLDAIIRNVAAAAPGLLKVSGSRGLVDPYTLLDPLGLGWAALVASVVTIVTALNWIQAMRDGIRAVMEAGPLAANLLLLKAKDAGTLVLLGLALIVSAVVTVILGSALDLLTRLLQLDPLVATPAAWAAGAAVAVLLNWLTAVILFRFAAHLSWSRRVFAEVTLLAGVGATILQLLSSLLLGRAGANPLLAPFAVIIGLLIWFNFVSQVYLFAAAWGAIRRADRASQPAAKPGRARSIRRA
ncbi:MAG: putative ribonuclease [Micrococcaceae bacterium]|nr:putative ribonuclease [Micrococcaceae bacterium]